MNYNIDIAKALDSMFPGAKWEIQSSLIYENLNWLDEKIEKPTKEEIKNYIEYLQHAYSIRDCKESAQKLLQETDWATLTDVGIINVSEFLTYRATIREFIKNPVEDPDFPDKPEPIWE